MRLIAMVVTAMMMAAPATAAADQSSPSSKSASPQKDTSPQEEQSPTLPVSLGKIREALKQPPPEEPLKGLNEQPLFRIAISERQKIDDLLKNLKFDSGPAVPGGLYGYEQQQVLFPKVENPLMQPYAAFNQRELLVMTAEALVENYLAHLVEGIGALNREAALAAAKEEVAHAVAEYCAAQTNGGSGFQICDSPPRP